MWELGLGGFGSGGHNKRCEHFEGRNRISIRYLRQHDLLQSGVSASMSWNDNWNRLTGSVRVRGGVDAVTLHYSFRTGESGDWRRVEEPILITRVPKPFGGAQAYLICPGCERRVVELAMGQGYFRCRRCHKLVHGSSQEGPVDRARRKSFKLRKRLDCEQNIDAGYWRPKNMRKKTFERIDRRIREADAEINDGFIRIIARIQRLDGGSCSSQKRRVFW